MTYRPAKPHRVLLGI